MKPSYIQTAFAKYIDRDLLARNPILYAQLKECFAVAFHEGAYIGAHIDRMSIPYKRQHFGGIAEEMKQIQVETRKVAANMKVDLWGKDATS